MKDKRFIELLNLYLDGEIDDTEKQLLDEALQKSSERRAIFQQYALLERASVEASQQFQPQMRKSVDFHKYAELARNADSRVFNGFAYSAVALLLVGVLLAGAFRFVGESVWEAVFDPGGESVAQVQAFHFEESRQSELSADGSLIVQSVLNNPLIIEESHFGGFSESAMDRFQDRWEKIKANASLGDGDSFSFGTPFPSVERTYRNSEETILAGFRFQR